MSVSAITFAVNADGVDLPIGFAQCRDRVRRNAGRFGALSDPLVKQLGDLGILANEDEHRRTLFERVRFPLFAQILPHAGQDVDRRIRPFQHRFRFRVRRFTASFRPRKSAQDPLPDVEIAGNIGAARIADAELRDLGQSRFDRIDQAEIADDPRKRPPGLRPHSAEKVGRRRQIDAQVDAALLVDGRALGPTPSLP